jgi:hypothetical protein
VASIWDRRQTGNPLVSILPPRLIAIAIQRSAGGRSPERVFTVLAMRTEIGALELRGST